MCTICRASCLLSLTHSMKNVYFFITALRREKMYLECFCQNQFTKKHDSIHFQLYFLHQEWWKFFLQLELFLFCNSFGIFLVLKLFCWCVTEYKFPLFPKVKFDLIAIFVFKLWCFVWFYTTTFQKLFNWKIFNLTS